MAQKFNIVLPGFPRYPGGGYKIMFEYANRLADKGFDVVIYYSMVVSYTKYKYPSFLRLLKNKLFSFNARPNWFKLSSQIKTYYIMSIKDSHIRNADYIISTWWATAFDVYKLNKLKGKKMNLIQDFENWSGHENLVYESYKLPINHIVINDYLKDLVYNTSGKYPILIYNAIDSSCFYIKSDITKRVNSSICMLYSKQPRKGSLYGLEALFLAKEKCPTLTVDLFGVEEGPSELPDWITYHRNPNNLLDIYNSNSIYFTPSNGEGWALPPAESMFCGCALVCTDIPGHSSYLRDGDFNLGVPPKNPQMMSEKLLYLLKNPEVRIDFARRGNIFIKQFSWDKAIESFVSKLEM